MTDSTAEFFQELGHCGHEPLLEKGRGTVRFDLVDGTRIARWLVTLDEGDVSVSRKDAAADCVVRAERTLVDAMASGQQQRIDRAHLDDGRWTASAFLLERCPRDTDATAARHWPRLPSGQDRRTGKRARTGGRS